MERMEIERQMQAADDIRNRQAERTEPKGLMERIQELWGNMQKDFQETGLGKALGGAWDFAAHENIVRDVRQHVVEQGWSGQIQTPLMREQPYRPNAGSDDLGRTSPQQPEAVAPAEHDAPMSHDERQETGSVYQMHRERGDSHVQEMDYLTGVGPERHDAPNRESRSGFWEREAAQVKADNMAAANLYLGTPDQPDANSIER